MQHEDKVHGSDSVWCVQRYPAEDGAGAHGERRTQLFALRDENVRETTALHKDPRPHRRTRSSRRLHFSPCAYTNTKDSFHWRCFRSQRSQAHTHTKLDRMERNDTLTLKFFQLLHKCLRILFEMACNRRLNLKVTQGHLKRHDSIGYKCFLFIFIWMYVLALLVVLHKEK